MHSGWPDVTNSLVACGHMNSHKRHRGDKFELKACKTLTNERIAQVLGDLRAAGKRHALLVNFGASKLETRKFIL